MAPKKKGGAKQETPEQLAARRAAAMAMFSTSSTPRPGAAAKPAAAAAAPAVPEEKLAALDVSDAAPDKGGAVDVSDDVFTDGGDDVRKQAVAYAASTYGLGGEHLVGALPTDGSWVTMLFQEPTPAMVKKAKKEGEAVSVPNEAKLLTLKDVAYLFDKEGKHVATWRTKTEGAELGTGEQPKVRLCAEKSKLIVGKEGAMLKAIQAHTAASLTMMPTGHVAVRAAGEAAVSTACTLIDNLLDGDGEETKKALAAHLVEAVPWCGELLFPCADEFVGGVIGKGGMGLKAIASESGALIDYVDPEEPDAASQAEAPEGSVKPAGHFRIRGKFENQCRLAAKRIEERLTVVQKLDTHGYVMVPRGAIGRLIGKGGANIKLLQRTSGASRLTFEKEGGGRSTTQACEIIASDISAAIGASKVVLEAVTVDSADARAALKARLEDYASQMMVGVEW